MPSTGSVAVIVRPGVPTSVFVTSGVPSGLRMETNEVEIVTAVSFKLIGPQLLGDFLQALRVDRAPVFPQSMRALGDPGRRVCLFHDVVHLGILYGRTV